MPVGESELIDRVLVFKDESGESPVREFLDDLRTSNPKAWAKCIAYLKRLHEPGGPWPTSLVKPVSNYAGMWECRPEYGNVEYRLLFYQLTDDRFLVVHAVKKKGPKLHDREFRLAELRWKAWQKGKKA